MSKPVDWAHNQAKYQRAETAQEYDRLRYQGPFRGTIKHGLHTRVLARAFRDVAPGSTVMDIPCGTARFVPWLVSRGYRVIGADLSTHMMNAGRDKTSELNSEAGGRPFLGFLAADATRLPCADKSIDATLTARFFHLVPEEVRYEVYRELARVCRGPIVLCFNCNKWAFKILWKRLLGQTSSYWMSRGELLAELEDGGLRVERIHSKGGPFSTLWVVVCRAKTA